MRQRSDPTNEAERAIWFPAKKHGWGWGPPITWQGWLVFVVYLVLVTVGVFALRNVLVLSMLYVLAVSVGFVAICWFKGEKPVWR